MSWFQRMNVKIDEGWKMTTMNCHCKTSMLIFMENKQLYCPKCDKIYDDIEFETECKEIESKQQQEQQKQSQQLQQYQQQQQQEQKDYLDEDEKRFFSRSVRNDESSKEIGRLLIQGWTMLDESCPECLQPIMKSKKGIKLCVQCKKEEDTNKPQHIQKQDIYEIDEQSNKYQQPQQQQPQQQQQQQQQQPQISSKTLPNNSKQILGQIILNCYKYAIRFCQNKEIKKVDQLIVQIENISQNLKIDSLSSKDFEIQQLELLKQLSLFHQQSLENNRVGQSEKATVIMIKLIKLM